MTRELVMEARLIGCTLPQFYLSKMATGGDIKYFQARFSCADEKYAVSKAPFSLPGTVGSPELNSLINGMLKQGEDGINFDFLINGTLLRSTLIELVEKHGVSTESVIEIEYVLKSEAPNLKCSILHDDWVSCIDMTFKRILSGSYDYLARIWNMKGELEKELKGHTAAVKGVCWGRTDGENSTILTSSQDQTIRIWEWSEGGDSCECIHVCKGHAGSVDCIGFSPERQKFCSGSWDKMIKIWSAVPDKEASDEIDPERDEDRKRIKAEPSRRKATTRTPLQTMSGHTEAVSSIQWVDATDIISSGWDHCIRVWDVQTGINKNSLPGKKVITSISHSNLSGLIASGSTDNYVRLWDPKSEDGMIVKSTLSSHQGWVSSVCWSPTSQYELLSGAYDSKVKVWDIRSTQSCLHTLECHQDKVMCVAWKEPEVLLSGGADNQLAVHMYNKGGTTSKEE